MKVIFRQSYNPKIEIIELAGDLSGSGARELKDSLFSHMDENKCKNYAIINFALVSKIDGFGIDILKSYISRGVDIRFEDIRQDYKTLIRDYVSSIF